MRQHINKYLEIYVVIGFIVGLITFCVGLAAGSQYLDANAMRRIGYEAEVINLQCYAKYQGRWLTCNTVATQSIQVTH